MYKSARVRNRDGRWLGGVWVDGASCCAKILTTHGIRALDLTTLLDSYSQAIDASWPLFWVWALPSRPVCEVRHPATDAKYNPRRRTLYATRTCFGIFLPHLMCVEARGSAVEGGRAPIGLTLYRLSLEVSASGGPRSVTCTGLLIPSSTGRKGVLRVGTIPRERGAFYRVA